MDRIFAVSEAFEVAYKGYERALARLNMERSGAGQVALSPLPASEIPAIMASLAPVAAAIYRQNTSLMVVRARGKATQADLERMGEAVKKLEISGNSIFASSDYEITFPERDEIKVIFERILGGDTDE